MGALLLRPRFGRHQAVSAVIDHQLAVVFAGVLDQPVGQIRNASQTWPAGGNTFAQPLVALCLDYIRAVLDALLYKGHDLRFSLQIVPLWIIWQVRLLSLRRIREVIHGSG